MSDRIIPPIPAGRQDVFRKIHAERLHQESRAEGGDTFNNDFDDKNTANDWASYIIRYLAQTCGFDVTPEEFAKAMIKVASLAVAAVEAVDRNHALPARHYDKD